MLQIRHLIGIVLTIFLVLPACGEPTAAEREFQKDSYYLVSDLLVAEYLPNINADKVRNLRLERATLSDREVAIICNFKKLERLELWGCELTDEKLKALRNLPQLEFLEISGSRGQRLPTISDQGISNIGYIAELKGVTLHCPNLTDAGMECFSKLNQLESVELYSDHVRGPGLKHLSNSVDLSSVVLRCPVGDDSMRYLATFPKLRVLWIEHTNVTDQALENLSVCLWLLNFTPSSQMTAESLRNFRNDVLKRRRRARLEGADVPWDDTLFIQNHSRRVSGNSVSPHTYASIDDSSPFDRRSATNPAQKKALQTLRDHDVNFNFGLSHVDPNDRFIESVAIHETSSKGELLPILAELTELNRLYITAVPLTPDDLKFLAKTSSLNVLNLSKCELTDDALRHLGKLTKLKVLILAQNPITDESLKHLSALESLEELNLSATQVQGIGLSHLSKSSRLQRLSVSSSRFNDEGIKHVMNFDELRTLDLDGTHVTSQGILGLVKMNWLSQISATDLLSTKDIERFHQLRAAGYEEAHAAGQLPSDFANPFGKLGE